MRCAFVHIRFIIYLYIDRSGKEINNSINIDFGFFLHQGNSENIKIEEFDFNSYLLPTSSK